MYRVLLPVDDDEKRAVKQAEFVAGLPCADDDVKVWVAHALHGQEREDYRNSVDRVGAVVAAVEYLDERGIATETADIALPPEDGILEEADRIDADLIAVGGRKRSPVGKAVFGSVSQSVALNAERPVTFAHIE